MYWFIAGIIALLLGLFYKITNCSFGKQKVTTGTITKINIALLYNKKSKDRSIKRSTNATFIIAIICFIMGIINVIGL